MTTKKTKLVMYNQRCFSQKHRAKTSLRKIFPVSNKAIDVRDALVRIATQAGREDPLKEVNGKTMESILQPGLFLPENTGLDGPMGLQFPSCVQHRLAGSRTNELAKYGWLNFVRLPCSPAKTIGDIQLQICRFETSRDDETTEYLAFEPPIK